ncbi:MFS transporter [Corynebacterium glyciniphilum]|uniref:MFS transporter n=1 Tax=Corynebacterium glyciniphilum TaxID=1404244 RepID=UPI0011AB4532|nr:MFS transporter [Corynebacterium glyciniphilum]
MKMNRRQRFVLATLLLPVVVISMDLTVLYLAAPSLSEQLRPSSSQLLWIMDAYGFVLAALLIPAGRLGDRIGRRRLLLIGALLFGFASLSSAVSTSAEWLIISRAMMGLGGATPMPSTLALIRTSFTDEQQRARAIGLWTAAFAAGGALGPVVAGVLLEFFPWGSVFIINVPVVLLLLLGIRLWVAESRARMPAPLPLVGALIGLVLVVSAMALLKQATAGAWSATEWLLLTLTIAACTAFAGHQRRAAHPLVDRGLVRMPTVRLGLLIVAAGMFTLTGPNMFLSQYMQLVIGLSPLLTSLAMVPMAVFGISGAILASALIAKLPKTRVIVFGLIAASIGLIGIAVATPTQSLILVLLGGIVLSIGVTTFLSLATDLTVSASPPDQVGSASALSETSSELGAALSIAVLGTAASMVYRRMLSLPPGLNTSDTEQAEQSLQNAAATADTLSESDESRLIEAAQTAFAAGQSVITAGAALLLLALAGAVVIYARRESCENGRASTPTPTSINQPPDDS